MANDEDLARLRQGVTFKKGQFAPWIEASSGGTEAHFVNRLFGLYA